MRSFKIILLSLLCAAALTGCGNSLTTYHSNDSSENFIDSLITAQSSIEATTELDSSSDEVAVQYKDSSSNKTKTSTTEKVVEATLEIYPIKKFITTTTTFIETKPVETTVSIEITTTPESITETAITENYLSEIDSYSYQLLAEIIQHEAGMETIGIYDKAHIAAAVMNRVYDSRFPNTVYENLINQSQFPGFYVGTCIPTQICYDAVDYYFAHPYEFDNSNSWYGDSYQNYFYYQ